MNVETSSLLKAERTHTNAPVMLSAASPAEQHFATDQLLPDLKRRTISSGFITIAGQAPKFFLTLGSTMILARLLTPHDFWLAAMVFGVLVGVTLAALGYGYWSLVWSILSTEAAGLVLTWSISRWRSQLPSRRSGVGPLVKFGAHQTGASLVFSIARGTDNLLIGRFFGSTALGLYSRASVLLVRPLEHFLGPVEAVIIPAL